MYAQTEGKVPIQNAPWWLAYLDTPPGWPKPWEIEGEPFHHIWMVRRTQYMSAYAEGVRMRLEQKK